MKVQGIIEQVFDVQEGTSRAGKEWKKLTFNLRTKEKYNNLIHFEVFGTEKVSEFTDSYSEDDVVEVEFNIKCREWQDKYFTSLESWKITKLEFDEDPNEDDNSKAEIIDEGEDVPF